MIAQTALLLLLGLFVLGFGLVSLKAGKVGNTAPGRHATWGRIQLTGNIAKFIASIYVLAGICMLVSAFLTFTISGSTQILQCIWGIALITSIGVHTLANIIVVASDAYNE